MGFLFRFPNTHPCIVLMSTCVNCSIAPRSIACGLSFKRGARQAIPNIALSVRVTGEPQPASACVRKLDRAGSKCAPKSSAPGEPKMGAPGAPVNYNSNVLVPGQVPVGGAPGELDLGTLLLAAGTVFLTVWAWLVWGMERIPAPWLCPPQRAPLQARPPTCQGY